MTPDPDVVRAAQLLDNLEGRIHLGHADESQRKLALLIEIIRQVRRESIAEELRRDSAIAHDIIFGIRLELAKPHANMEHITELLNRWEFAR